MKVKTLGKKAGKMVKSLLHNKYVLYLVSFLALTNVVGYLAIGDNRALGMFLALVLITSYFTKNLIIVFGVAMCGANVLLANNVVEGLKNRKKKKRIREGMEHKNDDSDSDDDYDDDDDDEPFVGGKDKKKGRIDFNATREAAYANLEKMLGPRGVSGLTKDASKLMNQQEKMMKNLESFAPLLSKAEKMMGQFSNISGSLGNVDGLLEKLADGKQELEKKE